MTQTIAVDENNDIFIDMEGSIAMRSGALAVLQNCETAVKAQRGEMIFFIQNGMPNFETVWSGNPNLSQFESALRQIILNVEGVSEIVSLIISNSQNVLSYVLTIRTIYGTIGVVNGAL